MLTTSYTTFRFSSYSFDRASRTIELRYALDQDVFFTETIRLSSDFDFVDYNQQELEAALFVLHLAGGISYYKTCLPPHIRIESGRLTAGQAAFWNRLYQEGLGQFFYENQVDFRGLLHFPSEAEEPDFRPHAAADRPLKEKRFLVPFGGGKDSCVSVEMLKEAGLRGVLFRQNAHPLIDRSAAVTGWPLLEVERSLSPALFELNAQGALNGHLPITAYISALTIVVSLLYGFDAVLMSNQRSSSEGNTEYLGMQVNHQWSKGEEFEKDFQDYLSSYVTRTVAYASLLRPFGELAVAKLFVRYPQYFPVFSSCNRNWRLAAERRPDHLWCGECPKCAFVFLLLAAFLPYSSLVAIFGENYFQKSDLLPWYRQMVGAEGFKPFECVGTIEECRIAFWLALKRPEYRETEAGRWFAGRLVSQLEDPEAAYRKLLQKEEAGLLPLVKEIVAAGAGEEAAC